MKATLTDLYVTAATIDVYVVEMNALTTVILPAKNAWLYTGNQATKFHRYARTPK